MSSLTAAYTCAARIRARAGALPPLSARRPGDPHWQGQQWETYAPCPACTALRRWLPPRRVPQSPARLTPTRPLSRERIHVEASHVEVQPHPWRRQLRAAPSRRRRRLHSSLWSLVTRIVRLPNFSTSSAVPVCSDAHQPERAPGNDEASSTGKRREGALASLASFNASVASSCLTRLRTRKDKPWTLARGSGRRLCMIERTAWPARRS